MGGAVPAVESGYMKARLVESNTRRLEAIERGDQIVVGVNKFIESEPSPLTTGDRAIMVVPASCRSGADRAAERMARSARRQGVSRRRLRDLRAAAAEGRNIMEPSIAAAKAGVTTGEWGAVAARSFRRISRADRRRARRRGKSAGDLDEVRAEVERVSHKLGRRLKFLVGKPGLDGHSNGAEQIAVRARDAGMDVVYEGIRLTPTEIVGRGAKRRRSLHRPLDSLRLSHPARARSAGAHEGGGARQHPGGRRRHHPAR